MKEMEAELMAAKKSYKTAKEVGNHQEEARWANLVGDILKKRGEYIEALRWLRIDYEVSTKFLPTKDCIPTCQSMGEAYLNLEDFKEALVYQKKHLQLAEDANDLVEQQRANTQLGCTYHAMLRKNEDDHSLAQNAKKYFKSSMKLAEIIKENPPKSCSFLKEYIDAHNNIGMVELDLHNLEEARKVLTKGVEICDEEEVEEYDRSRTRLYSNLGSLYLELGMWDIAREYIEKDIRICKRLRISQGEAKGYINLAEWHYRQQKYEEALRCYNRARDLAKSREDEYALLEQIDQNTKIVNEAAKVMDELQKDEQNLKKLARKVTVARGTMSERNCLLQLIECLNCLITNLRNVYAWTKHLEYAKRKKTIATELCDQEKLAESLSDIGESYHNQRKFKKALKWYMKSLKIHKSIGNLEGQALTKINIGNSLDSDGNWGEALDAYEESYRLAVEANVPSVQLEALKNMNDVHMTRFDNVEEARRLQLEIDKLKKSINKETETQNVAEDRCSESDTDGSDHLSGSMGKACCSPQIRKTDSSRSQSLASVEEVNVDEPLISLIPSRKASVKVKSAHLEKQNIATRGTVSSKSLSKSDINDQTVIGRKRVRVVLSDDEDEMQDEVQCSKNRSKKLPLEDVATSDELNSKSSTASPACKHQDASGYAFNCTSRPYNPVNIEQSSSSSKSKTLNVVIQKGKGFRASSSDDASIAASRSKCDIDVPENLDTKNIATHLMFLNCAEEQNQCITFKIDNDLIHLDKGSFMDSDMLSIESVKVELACLYYLRLPMERRSEGLLPIIQYLKFGETVLESLETIKALKQHMGEVFVEAFIDRWVQKRLIKLYTDCCYNLSETPNMKLVKELYDLKVSDDEVTVSECELQDLSITPLLNSLQAHKTFALLDLSHNLLGNGTMEKLQQVLTSSGQKYGGLTLDLHCNLFGPNSLFQICECPLLFSRLEVLNISGNRLTDACATFLSTIVENCKALCSLSIERCSITSRTIQKVCDALYADSVLEQLCIGHNLISGSAITNILSKLGTLKRFSKLSLNGLKLSKPVVDSLCQLAETLPLSVLSIGESGIGIDGALRLTESLFTGTAEFVKLDLSYCGVNSNYVLKLSTSSSMMSGILELNLSGNPVMQEGSNALSAMLLNSQCCLKVLVLQKCQLGTAGILQIIQALSGNGSLEELNLADNVSLDKQNSESSPTLSVSNQVDPGQLRPCNVNTDYDGVEVAADSEDDEEVNVETASSGRNHSYTSPPCRTNSSSPESQLIQELSTAIGVANNLRFLDLSHNGISTQNAEILYSSWSRSRFGSAQRHIKHQTIHLYVEGIKCCVKPCCRKD